MDLFCEVVPHIFLYFFWQGIPVRIEIGPRDVTNKSVVVSRRDVPGKQGKEFGVSMEPSILVNHIKGRLEDIQASLLQKAITFRDRYLFLIEFYLQRFFDLMSIACWLPSANQSYPQVQVF
jgi:prolyl-tRNA synthetase